LGDARFGGGRGLDHDNMALVLANDFAKQRRFREAADLANRAPDPKQREFAMVAVLREWSSLEDGDVDQYIAAGEVPDEIVAAYRKKMENHPIKVRRQRAPKQIKKEGEG
jgi:hypothetical protein